MPRPHRLPRLLTAALLLLTLATAHATETPAEAPVDETADRQALLHAWEQAQKNDPLTVTFEQTAPGTYHLKTTRFPYDGSVRIGGMIIRAFPEPTANGTTKYGVVEPTLDQDNAKFESQYPESFNDWRARNSFYYKPEAKAWIDSADMHFTPLPASGVFGKHPFLSFYIIIVCTFIIIFGLIILRLREWRAVQKRFKESAVVEQRLLKTGERSERAFTLQEQLVEHQIEQTRLLREILDALKQKQS